MLLLVVVLHFKFLIFPGLFAANIVCGMQNIMNANRKETRNFFKF